jgi:hypothetical protein
LTNLTLSVLFPARPWYCGDRVRVCHWLPDRQVFRPVGTSGVLEFSQVDFSANNRFMLRSSVLFEFLQSSPEQILPVSIQGNSRSGGAATKVPKVKQARSQI